MMNRAVQQEWCIRNGVSGEIPGAQVCSRPIHCCFGGVAERSNAAVLKFDSARPRRCEDVREGPLICEPCAPLYTGVRRDPSAGQRIGSDRRRTTSPRCWRVAIAVSERLSGPEGGTHMWTPARAVGGPVHTPHAQTEERSSTHQWLRPLRGRQDGYLSSRNMTWRTVCRRFKSGSRHRSSFRANT